MSLDQLRVASKAGGIVGVTLKGQGGAFLIEIATLSGSAALLAKARSSEPRRFGNPTAALNVLRAIGITAGQFEASAWNPSEKEITGGNRGRADAMRKAHQAAAYRAWLSAEIEAAIADPRPNLSHEEVLAEMDAEIARLVGEQQSS